MTRRILRWRLRMKIRLYFFLLTCLRNKYFKDVMLFRKEHTITLEEVETSIKTREL